ncbi:MAG: ethanolamine utilization protein EutH [Clostridia bacterium]|nr:ethanolamine utilization protein EutH [Clostridia bacterium]
MDALSYIIITFSLIGALDRILGNRFGLGKEFEKGFMLFGTMALSMIGMIIISPFIADIMTPFLDFVSSVLHIDPSIIPASLFANDMGGAPLAVEVAKNEEIGLFNAMVVSSMMGCTISFTLPFALGMVDKEHHRELLLGLLCGVVTIPIGCFVSGLICSIQLMTLVANLMPLIIFSAVIAFGLIRFPSACVKVFNMFGYFIKVVITIGLLLGIIRFLSGFELIKGLETLEAGAAVCLNASVVMSGAFPFMYVVSKVLAKPLKALSGRIGINEISALGFISSLATSVTTFGMMDKMDNKGIMMNSAFAVSAAFTFAGHLAFTLAFDRTFIMPMIVGKLISGALALLLSVVVFNKSNTVPKCYEKKCEFISHE